MAACTEETAFITCMLSVRLHPHTRQVRMQSHLLSAETASTASWLASFRARYALMNTRTCMPVQHVLTCSTSRGGNTLSETGLCGSYGFSGNMQRRACLLKKA